MTPPEASSGALERSRAIAAEKALQSANEFILFHYATGLMGTVPRLVSMADRDVWVVPVVLTSPGFGTVGEVGMVAVDAGDGKVVGSTPRSEVIAAQRRLREKNLDAIEAAFLRAREA
ncbi:MAG: hypothetical protein HY721_28425 [Planctomycetes bacterium]|nr:hypothetical protein [Planctomycetota bacterium]